MKHLFVFFTVCIFTTAAITGCSTKFNVDAPYKNITLVYGILDNADSVHYIRIQKSFLSATLSAYDMAKVSDSSFYPQLNVVLKAYNNSGSLVSIMPLTKIDLNTVGQQKDTGTFFTSPNYAYQLPGALDPLNSYTLVITNPATGEVDSSTTTVVDESLAGFKVPLIDIRGNSISFEHVAGSFIISATVPSNVAYVQGVLRIKWVEKNSATTTSVNKYADWNFGYATPSSGSINMKTSNAQFYSFLLGAMPTAPANVTRVLDSLDLFLYAANNEYYTYMQATQTLGTGLTGMDVEPIYTNISSSVSRSSVLGLFAGRGVKNGEVTYGGRTVDSIMADPAFTDRKITGTTY